MKQLIPNFESITYLVAKIKEYISKEFKSLSPLKNDKELVKLLSMPVDLQHYSVPEYTNTTTNHLPTKWVNLITERGCEGIFTYNEHPIFDVNYTSDNNYDITVMENESNNISLRKIQLKGRCLVDSNKQSYIYFVKFPNGNTKTNIYYFDFDNSYSHDEFVETKGPIIFSKREISNESAKMYYTSSSLLITSPSTYKGKRYCYDIGESIMMYSSQNIYDSDMLNKRIWFNDFLIKTPITISTVFDIEIDGNNNTLFTNYILRTINTTTNVSYNNSYYITTETYLYTSLADGEVDVEYYNDINITYTYKNGNEKVYTHTFNYTLADIINGSIYDTNTQPMTINDNGKIYYFSGKMVMNREISNFNKVEIKYYN